MKFRTYLQLRHFLSVLVPHFQDVEKVAIAGLYLRGENFDPSVFYSNHYLRDCLGFSELPVRSVLERLLAQGSDAFSIMLNERFGCREFHGSYQDIAVLLRKYHDQHLNKVDDIFRSSQLSVKVVDEIREYGFTIQQDLFKPEAFGLLVKEFNRIAMAELSSGNAYLYGKQQRNQRLYGLFLKSQIFRDLLESPMLNNFLNELFYRETHHSRYGLSSIAGHVIPPGGEDIPWHIDSVVPSPIPPWLMRFIVVIPLTDFTETNGATEIVPASHKYCRQVDTNDQVAMQGARKLIAPKGSLIMWDGLCWHRSGSNMSDEARPAIIISYAASFFREICGEENYVQLLMKKDPANILAGKLSSQMLDLIGYNRGLKSSADLGWDL